MIRETFPVGPFACNCTILGDEVSREAIVVDPGEDLPRILMALAAHRLTVKQIVVTHAHIDHIAGAGRLKAVTGASMLYSQADLPQVEIMEWQANFLGLPSPGAVAAPDHSPADGETIGVRGVSAEVLYTPGHTEGSLCLRIAEPGMGAGLLLAGDTLFAGAVGRTDLPGGHHGKLLNSIRERLLPLPDATVVVPGHGGETTIGEERALNPFLQL